MKFDRFFDKSNIRAYVIEIIGSILFLCLLGLSLRYNYTMPYQNLRLDTNGVIAFEDGFSSGDKRVRLFAKGEGETYEKVLPKMSYYGECLAFMTNGLRVKASLNGSPFYSWGNTLSAGYGNEVGLIWNVIPLRKAKEGDVLTISVESVAEDGTCNFSSFVLGTQAEIKLHILHQNMWMLMGCLFGVFAGLILIGYGIYCKIMGTRRARELSFTGFFALLVSLWVFTNSTIFQLFMRQIAVRYQSSYYLFLIMFVPAVLLFKDRCVGHKKILTVENFMLVGVMIASLLLYITGIAPLSYTRDYGYAVLLLLFLTTTVTCIREIRMYDNKKVIVPFVMSFFFVTLGFVDFIFFRLGYTDNGYLFFSIGLLILVSIFSISCFRDNAANVQENKYLSYYKSLAFMDRTTGGNSVNYFEEKAREIIQKSRGYVIAYLDVKKFKLINESIGNESGDELLKLMYREIEKQLYEDELLCHTPAAHFFLLLRNEGRSTIRSRLDQMKRTVNWIPVGEMDHNQLNILVGVYEITEEDISIFCMIDRAIMARNENDIEIIDGFGCGFYDESIRSKLVRNNDLKNRMLAGMHAGEFQVYLQPKVDPTSGRVRGAEALARWADPIEGMISPTEFIPVFESNGAIIQMNLFMLRSTIRFMNELIGKGITPPRISVNLSKVSIHNPLFMDEFISIMEDKDTPAQYLEFEFTENIMYESAEKLNELVDRIHQWGATCSIDDFGCGYSNLTMLKEVSVDVIKLDRGFFVYEEDRKEQALMIVKGLIDLAHSLGIEVVAEGVEDREQVLFLRDQGCDMIQGYYFSKPLPENEFEVYISQD